MSWEPDYATLAQLKGFVRITDNDDDTRLLLAITAASRAVDRHTGRQFGKVDEAEERRYTARLDRTRGWHRPRWLIDIDDLMTTAGLEISIDNAGAVTVYTLEPVNAAQRGRPWERLVIDSRSGVRPRGIEHEVAVTAPWGWTTVQDTVTNATLLQASRLFSRKDSPYGIAGSPEMGSEMRLLAKVDPDVQTILEEYVRHFGAV